jgi:hypothetical protein
MKPEEVFMEATKIRKRPDYVYADDYSDSIVYLRDEKNMTWAEIAEFLKKFNLEWSHATLTRVYRLHQNKKNQANQLIRQAEELVS